MEDVIKKLEKQASEFSSGLYHVVACASLSALRDVSFLYWLGIKHPINDEEIERHRKLIPLSKAGKAGAYFPAVLLFGSLALYASQFLSDTPNIDYPH
ncbi:MAG: hypothetical protein AABX29_00240 [Nanoarchaeota archaeon]